MNSTVDAVDAVPGDGECASSAGECTLRAAIMEANARATDDNIELPAGAYRLDLAGTDEDASAKGDLDVSDALSISAAGSELTFVDGADLDRVIDVHSESLVLSGLTIRGAPIEGIRVGDASLQLSGSIVGSNVGPGVRLLSSAELDVVSTVIRENGGGIEVTDHTNTEGTDCEISANTGSGLYSVVTGWSNGSSFLRCSIHGNTGSGVDLTEMRGLMLVDSVVAENGGWGIYLNGGVGIATVVRSSIRANQAGGISIPPSVVPLVMNLSTVSDNQGGGGIAVGSGGAIITSSTISGNFGGGIIGGDLTLVSTTVTRNHSAGTGAGLLFGVSGTATVQSSIVAENFATTGSDDCGAAVPGAELDSLGHNLIGDGTGCDIVTDPTDRVGTTASPVNPRLGPLANNGGLTFTHALLAGSPALEVGGACPGTDQRDKWRPFDADFNGSVLCDIGAYESRDFDGDGIGELDFDNCGSVANPTQSDVDLDSVGDACDNCLATPNARMPFDWLASNPWAVLTGGQRDDDVDGYGNRCDAKFPGSLGALVGPGDLSQLRASSGKNRSAMNCGTSGARPCAIFDLDESGLLIGPLDLSRFRLLSGKAPGPKCAACPLSCDAGALRNCQP